MWVFQAGSAIVPYGIRDPFAFYFCYYCYMIVNIVVLIHYFFIIVSIIFCYQGNMSK